jgi:hypothetical protein
LPVMAPVFLVADIVCVCVFGGKRVSGRFVVWILHCKEVVDRCGCELIETERPTSGLADGRQD